MGDRLALVEVLGGLRLDAVPETVEIEADELLGWGHPFYVEGEYVFLRLDGAVELDAGIPRGPFSWDSRYVEAEIDALLTLAEEHDLAVVKPVPIETTDAAVPTGDGVSSVLVLVAVVAGLVAVAGAGYALSKRR